MQVRAIIGSRLSVYAETRLGNVATSVKTGGITQHASTERYCQMRGWDVVGSFEDLDVSASVSPWERPELSPWLKERSGDWDAIVWTKVDRAFRDIGDCADVARWAETNKKILVFTEDGIVLNFKDESDAFATMMAKAFLMIASIFAELELQRIKTRYKDAHAYLRTTSRWVTGRPPFGYMIVPHPEGAGKALEVDPVSSEYVRLMAKMIIDGKSVMDTAATLTEMNIPTPSEYQKTQKGGTYKHVPSNKWSFSSVYQILRNPASMGLKTTVPDVANRGGRKSHSLARGKDGMPIVMAEPLFTDEEWGLLQAKLDERGSTPERTRSSGLLLGVAYCGSCGHRLHSSKRTIKGRVYGYYACPKRENKPACKGHNFKEDRLLDILDDQAPQKLAQRRRMRKVFKPGEDHSRELARVIKAMDDVRMERDNEGYDYPGGEDEYQERMSNLRARRKVLAALPNRADEWVEEDTGETYADAYLAADRDARRRLLMDANIRIVCTPELIDVRAPKSLDGLLPALVVVA